MKNKNKSTKFPVARIKKIMQKDEEVGKVAQATPIVISKALELFLNLIIEESHKVTSDRGSKKIEAYHLKYAIENTEMLDFLKDLVVGVPDPSAGGTIDLESESHENKKKRGKGKKAAPSGASTTTAGGAGGGDAPAPKRRRKKKADSDETPAESSSNARAPEPALNRGEDGEEDTEMNEYDDDDDQRNDNGVASYQPRSSSEDDGWENGKPYIPGR